jgi:cytochrome P450
VQRIADGLVDDMLARDGGEGDLLAQFAFPLPITVICELLGVPLHDRDSFRAWSNAIAAGMASGVDNRAVADALAAYIHELIAAKRASLGDDLLSELIAVRDDTDRLTEHELVAMVFLLLIAGHETTVNLIGNGAYLLLTHPEQRARLAADPGLVPAAVEEFLRYESPVETSTPRFTTEPVEVGGVSIPAGELVLVALASANRDPERFAGADRFDIERSDSAHVAFGHGIHFCLGAPLARLEGQVAFETLLSRLPGLALAVPPDGLAWRPGLLMRGLVDLPVRW